MIVRRSERPGYVLIAVMVVVVVLSYTSYRYLDSMTTEYTLAVRDTEQVQVRSYAISGVHFAAGALADQTYLENTLGGVYADNAVFRNAIAGDGDGPRGGGRFSLPNVQSLGDGTYATSFGAADESGKLNINAMILTDPTGQALYTALMLLPNMTEDVADAIVDWVDVDDTPRAAGAEAGDYSNFRPKNGPLNTLDELLLVRGVTTELLFGTDRNRNGVADVSEGGTITRGWSEFLTCYGREPNVDSTGTKRIDLTADDLSTLYEQLLPAVPQELADYLIAYRAFTTSATGTTSSSSIVSTGTINVSGNGTTFTMTQVSGGGGRQHRPSRPRRTRSRRPCNSPSRRAWRRANGSRNRSSTS